MQINDFTTLPFIRKSYSECMDELTADRLYDGLLGHGLFAEKLPPIFTSEDFCEYCKKMSMSFADTEHDHITFEVMRNTNVPRTLGIPNPMAYARLCEFLRDKWDELKNHFGNQTNGQKHKISRIHVRRIFNTKKIFEMIYDDFLEERYIMDEENKVFKMKSEDWRTDGSPVVDLRIGSKYKVSADISNCFPSIYTHALPWAIIGKNEAKNNRRTGWYNDLDKKCQKLKNGETHGILIGPHASNLISEIILTVIDKKLYDKEFKFIRNIDDYTCFVETYAKAQEFLQALSGYLRHYGLSLNNKKTSIDELPLTHEEEWVNKLNTLSTYLPTDIVNYKHVQRFLDDAISLFYKNNKNSSILNYAIQILSGFTMTKNAMSYFIKTSLHFSLNFTYLVPIINEHIFNKFAVERVQIESFSNRLFYTAIEERNHEQACYAIYFSLMYGFELSGLSPINILDNKNFIKIIDSDNCITKLFLYLYSKKFTSDAIVKKKFIDIALQLYSSEIDQNWLLIYEILPAERLQGEWKPLKKAGISFLRPEFR